MDDREFHTSFTDLSPNMWGREEKKKSKGLSCCQGKGWKARSRVLDQVEQYRRWQSGQRRTVSQTLDILSTAHRFSHLFFFTWIFDLTVEEIWISAILHLDVLTLDRDGICSICIKASFYIIDASEQTVWIFIIHLFHKRSSALETRLQQEESHNIVH